MADLNEQNEPVLDEGRSARDEAPRDDKVQGILDQTRADLALRPDTDVLRLLSSRLADAHIELGDEEVAALAADIEPPG